jgi:hypothetical protein
MHCCELLELAVVVSTQGAVLVRGAPAIPDWALHQYWSASKSRLDRWGRALKASASLADQDIGGGVQWEVFRDVLVESLAGEVLTRTWTAVVCAHDRLHNSEEGEPIVRSVYLGHLDISRRVLSVLEHLGRLDPLEAASLNRLRCRCERWSDWLVGHVGSRYDVCEFAANPIRAAEFADDLRGARTAAQDSTASRLLLASIRAAFREVLTGAAPNYDLNLAIATSILACFAPVLFDGAGTLRSVGLDPLLHPADEAQGLIEGLFREERAERAPAQRTRPLGESHRWWRYGG